jgi:hypothetical protein
LANGRNLSRTHRTFRRQLVEVPAHRGRGKSELMRQLHRGQWTVRKQEINDCLPGATLGSVSSGTG